jgi:uncharacterized membrane protein YeiB
VALSGYLFTTLFGSAMVQQVGSGMYTSLHQTMSVGFADAFYIGNLVMHGAVVLISN